MHIAKILFVVIFITFFFFVRNINFLNSQTNKDYPKKSIICVTRKVYFFAARITYVHHPSKHTAHRGVKSNNKEHETVVWIKCLTLKCLNIIIHFYNTQVNGLFIHFAKPKLLLSGLWFCFSHHQRALKYFFFFLFWFVGQCSFAFLNVA